MALQGTNGTLLKEILESIDCGETQLPDFQRGWVWEDKRIRALIASITNGYPIGAAMLLEYAGCDAHFKYRLFEGVDTSKSGVSPRYLVLDGQQRTTSLYRAVFSKKVVKTCDDKKKEIKRYYYLDIPKCLDTLTDRIDAVVSVPDDKIIRENIGRDIKRDVSSPEKEYKEHLFPLNIVFDTIAYNQWQRNYCRYHNSEVVDNNWDKFSDTIIARIIQYALPLIILDNKVPKEAVCQVFENVNQGGVSLTVFELVTASFAADNFELRKDWDAIWKQLKTERVLKYKDNQPAFTGVDFLTAITLLSSYLKCENGERNSISCKKKDVLSLKLADYQSNRDRLLSGIREAVKFIQAQCIYTSIDLPYTSQLIPLSVLFAIDKNLWYGAANRSKLEQWYWCGVFGELYGGANETRYVTDIAGMMKWVKNDNEQPDTIVRSSIHFNRLKRLYTRNSAAYKGVMALILKNGAVDFISGGNLDFASYVDESTDIHHIFPQSYCEKQGIDRQLWNSVINKTPIYARSNRSIGGVAPSIYTTRIENRDKISPELLNSFISSHLVDITSFRNDDFNTYFNMRAQSFCDLIEQVTKKPVEGRYAEVESENNETYFDDSDE